MDDSDRIYLKLDNSRQHSDSVSTSPSADTDHTKMADQALLKEQANSFLRDLNGFFEEIDDELDSLKKLEDEHF